MRFWKHKIFPIPSHYHFHFHDPFTTRFPTFPRFVHLSLFSPRAEHQQNQVHPRARNSNLTKQVLIKLFNEALHRIGASAKRTRRRRFAYIIIFPLGPPHRLASCQCMGTATLTVSFMKRERSFIVDNNRRMRWYYMCGENRNVLLCERGCMKGSVVELERQMCDVCCCAAGWFHIENFCLVWYGIAFLF